MASGSPVVQIIAEMFPGANFPQPTRRVGGSTPAEGIRVLAFDAAAIEYMDYLCELVGYAGGGLTISFKSSAATATTGVTRWGIAFRRDADDAEDVDTAQTYDFNELDVTAPSASGEITYDNITFTDGADMDSLANGDTFIMRVRRNASHANDTMTGDAELWSIVGKET